MPVGVLVPVPQSGEAERHVGRTAACGQLPLVEVNEVESTSALEQDMEYSEATAEAVMLSLSLSLSCLHVFLCVHDCGFIFYSCCFLKSLEVCQYIH